MKKRLKKVGKPKLIVECENITTLVAVADTINRSGLNAKVLMEYEILGENNEKSSSGGLGCNCD